MPSALGPDERAVSPTVGYALTLVITTLLVTGLLIAGGDFVQNQREQATLSELRVLGQQLAGDVSAADRLARTSGPDGDVRLRRGLPEQVAGTNYRVNASRIGASNTTSFVLVSDNPEERTEVRVHSEFPVFMKTNLTGGEAEVTYNSVREEVVVRRPGPFVFQESGGEVVIEAESYPEDHPGEGEWDTHYWKAFEDGGASGGTAVTTYPNVSSSGGTGDSTEGTRLDYEVDFENGGLYYVYVRMRAPSADSGNSDSIHVSVEDNTPPTYGGQGLTHGSGTTWSWVSGVSSDEDVQIDAGSGGVKTLHIWMREDGTQVDKIILSDTPISPSGTGPTESEWA